MQLRCIVGGGLYRPAAGIKGGRGGVGQEENPERREKILEKN